MGIFGGNVVHFSDLPKEEQAKRIEEERRMKEIEKKFTNEYWRSPLDNFKIKGLREAIDSWKPDYSSPIKATDPRPIKIDLELPKSSNISKINYKPCSFGLDSSPSYLYSNSTQKSTKSENLSANMYNLDIPIHYRMFGSDNSCEDTKITLQSSKLSRFLSAGMANHRALYELNETFPNPIDIDDCNGYPIIQINSAPSQIQINRLEYYQKKAEEAHRRLHEY